MTSNRRTFLTTAGLSAAALASASSVLHAAEPSALGPALVAEELEAWEQAQQETWDISWAQRVTGKHKAMFDVPEIADGSVEIAGLAREAGHRTKIAVKSTVPGLNAKGACIGPMGQRVRQVMSELGGEKIDIVDFSEDPAELIAHALSPARVSKVEVVDRDARAARVTVPDYQLSLAIGREGQNARLAARLTGWRIDIRSDTEQGPPAPAPEDT